MKIRFLLLVLFIVAGLSSVLLARPKNFVCTLPTQPTGVVGPSELKLRPTPVRIFEHPGMEDWVLLSPNGYFEYVERDYKSPTNINGKYPLKVRVSGSYREVPVKKSNGKGGARIDNYHLVFNIDQKSLIRLSGSRAKSKILARLTEKLQRNLTERVEDGIEADINHGDVDTLVTGMRIITSPVLAATSLLKKSWSQETFLRIGPLKFMQYVEEGRPDVETDLYTGQPLSVLD